MKGEEEGKERRMGMSGRGACEWTYAKPGGGEWEGRERREGGGEGDKLAYYYYWFICCWQLKTALTKKQANKSQL